MGNFDRGVRTGVRTGGRGFERSSFSDRGPRRPVQMNQAICSNCGKSCEVPFRPTSGKPVFCSSCFENERGSDSRGSGGKNWEEKPMFDAVCADCGDNCKVPFRPSGEKPVFCSNCFGEKKGSVSKDQPQFKDQLELLNIKLDRVLAILEPDPSATLRVNAAALSKPVVENQEPAEQVVTPEKKPKTVKKKSSKKD